MASGRPAALRGGRCAPLALAAVALLLPALRASPTVAGCCQKNPIPSGCFDTPNAGACDGTYYPSGACDGGTGYCSVSSTTTTVPGSTTSTTLWPGYSDGRLNPALDEYYSIYCRTDLIEVVRSVPQTQVIKTVPLFDVIFADMQVLALGDFMSLVRTGDVVSIYGSNGNRAPEPGQKNFSLGDCIARNGGLPDAPPPKPPAGDDDDGDYQAPGLCADPDFFASFLTECLEDAGLNPLGICLAQVFFHFGPVPPARASRTPRALVDLPGDLDVLQLYRLRDRVLQATPGGRRATQLYYQYSKDLVIAGIHDSAVLTTGRRALVAWMPLIDALVAGNGDAASVSAEQAALAAAFLAAVRAAGSEALLLALEREALLTDPDSLEGLTATEALARIEGLSCETAPTLESVRCRLADLRRLVREGIAGRAQRRLVSRVAKGQKQAKQAAAASAKGKGRHAAAKLRRVGRLLHGVERKLGSKKLAKKTPDAVRLVLGDVVAALRADTATLAQSP